MEMLKRKKNSCDENQTKSDHSSHTHSGSDVELTMNETCEKTHCSSHLFSLVISLFTAVMIVKHI